LSFSSQLCLSQSSCQLKELIFQSTSSQLVVSIAVFMAGYALKLYDIIGYDIRGIIVLVVVVVGNFGPLTLLTYSSTMCT